MGQPYTEDLKNPPAALKVPYELKVPAYRTSLPLTSLEPLLPTLIFVLSYFDTYLPVYYRIA